MTNEKAIMCLEDMKIKVPIPKAAKQAMENNEALDVAIKALKKEPHWIPVTERLPESKEEDLEYPTVIIDLDGQVALGCYYESTREWGMGEYFNQKCFPIAWMPLPEPYKGVTE